MFQNSIVNVGTFISMPIFHYFNLNDNIIILLAFGSAISIRIVKVFARSEEVFFASTAFGVFMGVSSAPIRAQMTRCVAAVELGKVIISNKIYFLHLYLFLHIAGVCHACQSWVCCTHPCQCYLHQSLQRHIWADISLAGELLFWMHRIFINRYGTQDGHGHWTHVLLKLKLYFLQVSL